MSGPQVALSLLVAFALVGAGCVITIAWYWRSVGRVIGDTAPKIACEVIQFAAGTVSVFGAYAAANRIEWLAPVVVGAFCVVVWKAVQILIDNRVKDADRSRAGELARAERQGELRTKLLTAFRRAVEDKVRRSVQVLGPPFRPGIAALRRALTPAPHLDVLLENLAVYLQQQSAGPLDSIPNVRVGVYINTDGAGVMRPVHAVSLDNPGYTPFTSLASHADRFRLGCQERPSLVVVCVRRKGTVLVEDCVAADAASDSEFKFFGAGDQPCYLRSMAAHYIGEVCEADGSMREAALVIDANRPGFFREADRASIEYVLKEFACRLKLELLLVALLRPQGQDHDNANRRRESPPPGGAGAEAEGGTPPGDEGGRGTAPPDHPG